MQYKVKTNTKEERFPYTVIYPLIGHQFVAFTFINIIYQKEFLSTNEMVIHYQYDENNHIELTPIDMHICVDLSPYIQDLIVPPYIWAYTDFINQSKTGILRLLFEVLRNTPVKPEHIIDPTWTYLSRISVGLSGLCTTQEIEQNPYYINIELDPSLRDMIHMAMFAAVHELLQNHNNSNKYMILGDHLSFTELLIKLGEGVLMIQGVESKFIDLDSCDYLTNVIYDQITNCLFDWKGREEAIQYLLQSTNSK